MSYTVVLLPILSVLSIANNHYLQPDQTWKTANAEQQFFTQTYWPLANQLSYLNEKELTSIISPNVSEVNQFLKNKGFDIQLKPFENDDPGNCAIASILDILLKWKVKGNKSFLTVNQQEYPAVFMPTNESCKVRGYNNQEVAIIEGENNDRVYIMKAPQDQPLLNDFELIEYIKNIKDQNLKWVGDYADMLFPMVDINERVSLDWLIDLRFPIDEDTVYRISQALQQTKFQMNEEGAAAQSAVAVAVTRVTSINIPKPRKHLIIDKPFYVWIMRKGVDIPLFAAYVDEGNWKMPAKLGGK